jgi:hypothetical protein
LTLVRVICSNTDVPPAAVSGVLVRIFNQAGDTLVTDGTSDASGYVEVDIPNATYQVRASKTGCAIAATTYITVIDPPNPGVYNEFDLSVAERTIGPASESYLCRIGGILLDGSGRPQEDAVIAFMLKDRKRVDSKYTLDDRVEYETDEDGWVVFELFRGAKYEVVVGGSSLMPFEVEVADADEVELGKFLYPIPAQITWNPSGPIAATVASPVEVDASVVMDSKVVYAAGDDEVGDLVAFTSSDEAVIHVSGGDGELTIMPVAAGTANVVATISEAYDVQQTPVLSGGTLVVNVT